MLGRKLFILLTAILLGFFITAQGRSFENVNDIILRDGQNNVYQEISILKEKNENLREEVDELENNLKQLADQNSALDAIQEEIIKYQKISGDFPIYGQGMIIKFEGNMTTAWIIDLINELFATGAQAIEVNGIRISNITTGFDTLPRGQILLNGTILSPPYVFGVIGDSTTLVNVLEAPGGFFDRTEATFKNIVITSDRKDIIQMN